ncbi:hypothetical protein [Flavobacterium pedocola]
MGKKLLFFILFVFVTFSTSAQTEDTKPKNWIVKWNTTAAVDVFSFPTIQFAAERKLNNYFSVQTELGVQLYDLGKKTDTISVNTSGYRVITEGRFYFYDYFKKKKADDSNTAKEKPTGIYTGIQVFYRRNSYNYDQSYYRNESDYDTATNMQTDELGVNKEVYGINLCFGYQMSVQNFVLEPYMYVGGLKRNIKNFDRKYDTNLGHIPKDNIHYFGKDLEEMSGTDGNFSIGFRVGYRL